MDTPAQLLDQVRARHNLPSDYAAAKLIGAPRQLVSKWRQGHGGMGDEYAARVAQLLELDPGYVLARLYAERATSDEARRTWLDLARRLAPAVACVLALLLVAPLLGIDQAAAWGGTLCIMSTGVVVLVAAAIVLELTRTGEARPRHGAGRRGWRTA